MAFSVSKKKSKLSKRKEINKFSFFRSFVARVFFRFPSAVFVLILLLIYCSSTTLISGNVVHVCVSSRKLNNLYCITAGSQPSFEVPGGALSKFNDSNPHVIGDDKAIDGLLKSSTAAVNNNVTKSHDVVLENKVVEVPIPLVVDSSSSVRGEKKGDLEKGVDVIESSIFSVNSSTVDKSNNEGSENVLKGVVQEVPVQAVNSIILDKSNDEGLGNVHKGVVEAVQEVPVQVADIIVDKSNHEGLGNVHNGVVESVQEGPVQAANNIFVKPNDEELETAYKDVEEQLRVHRSWNSNHDQESCDGKGIYVYELPSKFNKDLLNHCGDMIPWVDLCKYFSNDALGEPIHNLGQGWYKTNQYALEPIFHSRVLKHPCRVNNQNEAKLFYVPYYGGLDILRWHFKNVTNDVKDSLALALVRWLETQEPWFQNQGKDHVFVLGKISWDFRRNSTSSWGTQLLELAELQNPIKLLLERQPWEVNDIGIPHPTSFHPHTDDDILNWQSKIIASNRASLTSFAGGARPDDPENIRSILINQCSLSEQCKLLNCSLGGCNNPESIIELFMHSEFCWQPPGDSPTRKSVFDSLISGCIPVLFDPFTAYYQYPWHLPEDHGKYSVYIDKDEVKNKKVNVIERLMKISKKEKDDMRRYIVYELLPRLVYADSNSQLQNFQDAFTITMNNLLGRINKLDEL